MLQEWKGEVEWFLETLEQIESRHQMRVALCHNDLNHNNILIPGAEEDGDKGEEDTFILIDYEYTGLLNLSESYFEDSGFIFNKNYCIVHVVTM